MAKNTSYQSQLDGKDSGVISSNRINEPTKVRKQHSNTFDCDYQLFSTERYGDISPFFVSNGVIKDTVPLINAHELRTYTLQAPLMSDVYKHKNYFQVPMKSILPNTWDYIFANPVKGDDVPSDAYCAYDFMAKVRLCLHKVVAAYNANRPSLTVGNVNGWFANFIRTFLFFEHFYSTGNVLSYLGFSSHAVVRESSISYLKTYDNFFDECVVPIIKAMPTMFVTFNGRNYSIEELGSYGLAYPSIPLRRFLELAREDPFFTVNVNISYEDISTRLSAIDSLLEDFGDKLSAFYNNVGSMFSRPIDYSRLVAYQLVCAHFFSNDNIDYLYNADLYRKNLLSFIMMTGGTSSSQSLIQHFDYNGTHILYDAVSARYMDKMFSLIDGSVFSFNPSSSTSYIYTNFFAYFDLLFGFRKSLKFVDYFTGSKSNPLAVGDVSAPVVNNSVSAIDMTVNISRQRFLNAVNRFGASVDDYVGGIFDSKLPPVDSDPKWLSNEVFRLFGTEVENTGSEQRDNNSVTTIIKSNANKFAFEAYCDVPSIFIGVSWYDTLRSYVGSADRFFFHKDRFDMFNPYMQYIGDQPIYSSELNVGAQSSNPVGYQGRYMEYKQRINHAVGGFANSMLPNWAAVSTYSELAQSARGIVIDPDFIRSSNTEFDGYYSPLTSYSLGNYFHFILKYSNFSSMERAMDYTPTIL